MDTELGFPDIPDGYLYFSEEEDGCLFPKGEASGDSQGLFDFSGFLNTPSPAGSPLIHPKRKQAATKLAVQQGLRGFHATLIQSKTLKSHQINRKDSME